MGFPLVSSVCFVIHCVGEIAEEMTWRIFYSFSLDDFSRIITSPPTYPSLPTPEG